MTSWGFRAFSLDRMGLFSFWVNYDFPPEVDSVLPFGPGRGLPGGQVFAQGCVLRRRLPANEISPAKG